MNYHSSELKLLREETKRVSYGKTYSQYETPYWLWVCKSCGRRGIEDTRSHALQELLTHKKEHQKKEKERRGVHRIY